MHDAAMWVSRWVSLLVVTIATGTAGAVSLDAQRERQQVRAQPMFADDRLDDRVDDRAGQAPVPAGTRLDIALRTALDSGTSRVDQRFEAATIADVVLRGVVVVPADTPVRGFVSSVRAAGGDRIGALTLSFEEVRIGDRPVRLRAIVEAAFEGASTEAAGRLAVGAAERAVIASTPGGQVLLAGALVRPDGTIVSTQRADVRMPVGTILRIRLDRAIEVF
jgi:hypothetical protein